MASLDNIWPFVLKMEGGYVNNPHDGGGPTNHGVTLATWKQLGHDKDGDGVITANDIKMLTVADAKMVAKWFWDYYKADQIDSQEVANIIYDWGWASGVGLAAKELQKMLGVHADGVFGPASLAALNAKIHSGSAYAMFDAIRARRIEMIKHFVSKKPDQGIFLTGWTRRIMAIPAPQKKS